MTSLCQSKNTRWLSLYLHCLPGLPPQLKQDSIDISTKSPLHNWILIHYVLHSPPIFYIRDKRVVLSSKSIARVIAGSVFASLDAETKMARLREARQPAGGSFVASSAQGTPGSFNLESGSFHKQERGEGRAWDIPHMPPQQAAQPSTLMASATASSDQVANTTEGNYFPGSQGIVDHGSFSSKQWPDQRQKETSGLRIPDGQPDVAPAADDAAPDEVNYGSCSRPTLSARVSRKTLP